MFDAAYAASSWTPPSMASLFTGVPPRAHGVTKGAVRDGEAVNQQVLDGRFTTIAESFRAAGYQTIGISSNAHVVRRTGFAQGFDAFRAPLWKGANEVSAAARELVAARPAGKPLLLWLHYFDPHSPYVPHGPGSTPTRSTSSGCSAAPGWSRKRCWRRRRHPETREDAGRALGLYDSEIAYVDAALRRLFSALPRPATRSWRSPRTTARR